MISGLPTKRKRGGQPGNQNSKGKGGAPFGNQNAIGNHGGAPRGNCNACKKPQLPHLILLKERMMCLFADIKRAINRRQDKVTVITLCQSCVHRSERFAGQGLTTDMEVYVC